MVEVAAQMGHAPTMTLNTYGHVIADMDGVTIGSAEEVIKAARADDAVPPRYPGETGDTSASAGSEASSQADARIRTGDPFITSEVLYQLSYVGEA